MVLDVIFDFIWRCLDQESLHIPRKNVVNIANKNINICPFHLFMHNSVSKMFGEGPTKKRIGVPVLEMWGNFNMRVRCVRWTEKSSSINKFIDLK